MAPCHFVTEHHKLFKQFAMHSTDYILFRQSVLQPRVKQFCLGFQRPLALHHLQLS